MFLNVLQANFLTLLMYALNAILNVNYVLERFPQNVRLAQMVITYKEKHVQVYAAKISI